MSDDLCFTSIHDLAGMIRKKEVSPVEVAEAHLRRIEALNPALFAYQTVTAELAMEEAKAAEAEIMGGRWRGPMHGVPYGAKDIVETAGVLTTHGSSFHRDNVPREDAEIIRRLKAAGAVMLGKTVTHEFAAAAVSINPHYGTVRNPWDTERIVGGSSGGSGAACAAGLGALRHRHGHGRLHPKPRLPVRRRGLQGHPRPGEPQGHLPQRPEPGPRGSHDAHGARRRNHASGGGGL